MKLEKIKLAGFKSFVDPTTIPINGNLTAIVGPNGCGKSNIIDAVRWVMGESSAKHLRGGHMADVIFNGSSGRKPVGTATVELIFNNSERKLGGEYAQYDTIAIKRQVSRDGQSLFMLNGSRCRRKDITDLFLGTGLGSRSYAIIEQGTISRMVEAKPEELRVHIEEAAGISKYKERRQETEMRMRHTRENLERLNDLRDEVEKQLKHLQKQAEKAEKYTALKKQERQTQLELLAMRWQGYQHSAEHQESLLHEAAACHNRFFVELRQLERQQEDLRAAYKDQQAQAHTCQGDFYTLTAEVSRLEQAIKHHQESHQQTTIELKRTQARAAEWQQELAADFETLAEIRQTLSDTEPQILLADQRCHQQHTRQNELEPRRQAWQQQWEQFQTESGLQKQHAEVLRVKIDQAVKSHQPLQARLDKLTVERQNLDLDDLPRQLASLEAAVNQLAAQREQHQSAVNSLQQHLSELRHEQKQQQQKLQANHAELAPIKGKISSLELLQQHALGKDNQHLLDWLACVNLTDAPRLAEAIDVQTGWETATEIVLGAYLDAVCVNQLEALITNLSRLHHESLAILALDSLPPDADDAKPPVNAERLTDKVRAPWPLASLLTGIYCTDTVSSAYELSKQLAPFESIITPDGSWFGPGWVKIHQQQDSKTGMLQREKDLRQLKLRRQECEGVCYDLEMTLAAIDDGISQTEGQLQDQQRLYHQLGTELSNQNAKLGAQQAHLHQQQRRMVQIAHELEELLEEQSDNAETIAAYRLALEDADQALNQFEQRRQNLAAHHQQLQTEAQQIAQAVHTAQQQLFELKAKSEQLRASEQATHRQIDRMQQQYRQTAALIAELQHKQTLALQPIAYEKQSLTEKALAKTDLESQLKHHRQLQEKTAATLNSLSEQYQKTQRALEKAKAELDRLRFEWQENQVRQQTINEQLRELNADVGQIVANLPPDAEAKRWKTQLAVLATDIEHLGTINLTAIEEYQTQSARMKFLDEQRADLLEALQTLDQAIHKMDQESRLRFQETFDKINSGLQEKFPKLFGGGHAYLELSEHDLLESGVTIIARPPGKRNSSIHLLSGGEKALTAVALVFSIFELNPAPFCLLDEVDAPLDDANVGRFSKMVEEMSNSVQFLYISHNKVTMEIARQLTGVTMKEPGVSRMVAVDIEEAVTLAEH